MEMARRLCLLAKISISVSIYVCVWEKNIRIIFRIFFLLYIIFTYLSCRPPLTSPSLQMFIHESCCVLAHWKCLGRIERGQWSDGKVLADEVGVSPSVSPKFPVISVPYGALVPARLNGLLAAGRHISCDANSHGFMREIPQCWLTGQAAGAAAGVAANHGVEPRAVDIAELQDTLRSQGAHVRTEAMAEAAG